MTLFDPQLLNDISAFIERNEFPPALNPDSVGVDFTLTRPDMGVSSLSAVLICISKIVDGLGDRDSGINEVFESPHYVSLQNAVFGLSEEFTMEYEDRLILSTLAKLALIGAEAGEAIRSLLSGDGNLGEELSDVIIRALGLMLQVGMDPSSEVAKKMEKLKLRPFRNGKKLTV